MTQVNFEKDWFVRHGDKSTFEAHVCWLDADGEEIRCLLLGTLTPEKHAELSNNPTIAMAGAKYENVSFG